MNLALSSGIFDGDIDKKDDLGFILHKIELLSSPNSPNTSTKAEDHTKETPNPSALTSSGVTYWAKGTGFGHSNASKVTWDIQSYLSAQKKRDIQIQDLLQAISTILSKPLSPDQKRILEGSSLFSFLERLLDNDSFLDLGRHALLYLGILSLLESLCSVTDLHETLKKRTALLNCLEKLNLQAKVFLSRLKTDDSLSEMELASAIMKCWKDVVSKLSIPLAMETDNEQKNHSLSLENMERVYMRIFPEHQFRAGSMKKSEGCYNHHYHNFLKEAAVHSKEKILRLAQEATALATSLPLTWSSSVFLLVDEERFDLMQCLITGPCDTPYDSGVFQFDIYFPPDYPNCPPLCNLQTTGGGSVRFNPNLYNCGKVCLSLLGTWSGAEGENWNREASTLLQVLVSIQSLIFVSEPYFNEPGYERQIGTKMGEEASRKYSETIRLGTTEHAILGQLKNPSKGFEQVIRTHFYLKKDYVLGLVEKWTEDAKNNSSNHLPRFTKALEEIREELQKLDRKDTLFP